MNLVCAYFQEREEYRYLRKIFFNSAKQHMPDVRVHFVMHDPPNREHLDHHQDTFFGFKIAAEYVLKLNQPCAVCDVDLMFRRSIADIWQRDFDIAVTVRDIPARYNTGLWFYRPTQAAEKFLINWIELTEQFAKDFNGIQEGIKKWAGIDQYSLACICKKDKDAHVIELPCQEWNAEQTCWQNITEDTRVIHLKSQLRNEIFGRPQQMKYDGVISEKIKVIPECTELANEALRWLI